MDGKTNLRAHNLPFQVEICFEKGRRKKLRDVCLFIVLVYVEAWFLALIALKSPNQDSEFLKKIHSFRSINKVIAKNALNKFQNHSCYLGPELSVLALFDTDVLVEVKLRIFKNLEITADQVERILTSVDEDGDCDFADDPPHTKRYRTEKIYEIFDKEIDFYVNTESLNFIKRFNIATNFLEIQPTEWKNN